jgi:hypothetical protein
MPTAPSEILTFDDIGFAYAEHLRELEAAQARFETCCARAMEVLKTFTTYKVREAGMTVDRATVRGAGPGTGPWCNVFIAKPSPNASSRKSTDGVAFALAHGDFWEDGTDLAFGLYPYLFFSVEHASAFRSRIDVCLGEIAPSATKAVVRGSWIYMVAEPLKFGPEFLRIEDAQASIAGLIKEFSVAASWIARSQSEP